MNAVTAEPTAPRVWHVAGRAIPVTGPDRRDPRLHVAIVLLTVQALGQTVLAFELSIAQIAVSIATAATIELALTLRRDGALVWPASALLTGNSVALLLRAPGTDAGQPWSLHDLDVFVLGVGLAMASKHLVRPGGRHVFNPSNVGLVWVLLLLGPQAAFPQYLWWGPPGPPIVVVTAVIVVGGALVLRRLRMLAMAGAFLLTFGLAVGLLALAGGEYWALWHPVAVTGGFYWSTLVLSPEVLIFVGFMISDPATAPVTPRGRIAFGVLTAVVAAVLLAPQTTEFGVKLAILSSLVVTCAVARPLDRWLCMGLPLRPTGWEGARRRLLDPRVAAVLIVAVAAPINTLALHDDPGLILLERGLSGRIDPQ